MRPSLNTHKAVPAGSEIVVWRRPVGTPHPTGGEEHVHVEELEVDASTLARAGARRFLRECAVPPAEITRTLRTAADAVGSAGTALLRVTVGPHGASVTVTATGSPGAQGASPAAAAAVEDPLLRAPARVVGGNAQARAVA